MAPSKKVESQRPCCQLEKMEDRKEKRQLSDVLFTDEGVRGGHGGDATSGSLSISSIPLHAGLEEDGTDG